MAQARSPSSSKTSAQTRSTPRGKVAVAIKRFQSGIDREASFRFLYKAYFSKLERFFARKGFAPEDRLDLTQETLLGIYVGLSDYRGEARFEVWLYRVATTTYLKRLRSAATAKRAGEEVSHDESIATQPALEAQPDQLDHMLEAERRQILRAAVRRLPEQMQRCLTLRLFHQLKYREIADVMKLNLETVKGHLFKARKKLKEELQGFDLQDLGL